MRQSDFHIDHVCRTFRLFAVSNSRWRVAPPSDRTESTVPTTSSLSSCLVLARTEC